MRPILLAACGLLPTIDSAAQAVESHFLHTLQSPFRWNGNAPRGTRLVPAGDIDRDSTRDFYFVQQGVQNGSQRVAVALVSGRTGLEIWRVEEPSTTLVINHVAVVDDLNADGVPDIVVCRPQQLDLWSGVDGAFLSVLATGFFRAWSIPDIDGDGLRDVVAQPPQISQPVRALSVPAGNVIWTGPVAPTWQILGPDADLTGDGIPEFIADRGNGAAFTFYSGATGTVVRDAPAPITTAAGVVAVDDLNGDGVTEYSNTIGSGLPFTMEIRSGADDTVLFALPGSQQIVLPIGDVNGDGIADLLANADRGGDPNASRSRAYSGADGTALWEFERLLLGPGILPQFSSIVGDDITGDGQSEFTVLGAAVTGIANRAIANQIQSPLGSSYAAPTSNTNPLPRADTLALGSFGDPDGDGWPEFFYGVGPPGFTPGVSIGYDSRGTIPSPPVIQARSLSGEDSLGFSAAVTGDIDANGLIDIAVGAPDSTVGGADSGRIILFAQGAGFTTQNFIIQDIAGEPGERLGYAVAGIRDLDFDGTDDLLAGAPDASPGGRTNAGKVYVFALTPPTNPLPSRFDGQSAGDRLGTAVAGLGDVDMDGTPDFAVGAPFDDNAGLDSGTVTVYSGATRAVLWTWNGDATGDNFGAAVAAAGDVNFDGFADVLIGAPADDNNGSDSGTVRVYSGRTGSILLSIDGAAAGDELGSSLAGGLDIDGDTFPDFAAGAPGADSNGTDAGSVRLVSGLTSAPIRQLDGDDSFDQFGSSVALADLTGNGLAEVLVAAPLDERNGPASGSVRAIVGTSGTVLYTLDGVAIADFFGTSLTALPDTDGDGRSDFAVGSPRRDAAGTDSGSARVFSGATGTLRFEIAGTAAFDEFGTAVAPAGDQNGDGIPDLATGAPFALGGGTPTAGIVRVSSGADGATLFRLDGDESNADYGAAIAYIGVIDGSGIDRLLIGAPRTDAGGTDSGSALLSNSPRNGALAVLEGLAPDDRFGTALEAIGDLNGDGFEEFIVGAPGSDRFALDAGMARVYSGRDFSILHDLDGRSPGADFGRSVTGLGDVNGDTIPDYAVGSPGALVAGVAVGETRVFSGATGLELWSVQGIDADDEFGVSIDGLTDANGDGTPDLLVGSPGSRLPTGQPAGRATVFSGAGGNVLAIRRGRTPNGRFGRLVAHADDIDSDGLSDILVHEERFERGLGNIASPAIDRTVIHLYALGRGGVLRPSTLASAAGCAGSSGVAPRMRLSGLPAIGTAPRIELESTQPGALAGVLIGNTPTRLDLGPIGASGCDLRVLPFVTVPSFGAPVPLTIANDPGIIGLRVELQAAAVDLAANALGVTTSNLWSIVIGG